MKHLFIARHASYDKYSMTSTLTEQGQQQYEALAAQIQPITNGVIRLISSPKERAVNSAEILRQKLGLQTREETDVLFSCDRGDNPQQLERDLTQLFEVATGNKNADAVILVGHLEAVTAFPAFCMRRFGFSKTERPRLCRGEAVHLDVENKAYAVLSSPFAAFYD